MRVDAYADYTVPRSIAFMESDERDGDKVPSSAAAIPINTSATNNTSNINTVDNQYSGEVLEGVDGSGTQSLCIYGSQDILSTQATFIFSL